MAGCVGDQVCLNGSCVDTRRKDGEGPPSCQSDADCPDFQTCIASACYSNCDGDDECPDGRICHRHVCRLECTVDETSCPSGDHCQATDGSAGVCMPAVSPGGDGAPVVEGSFSLSEESLSFSNVKVSSSLEITNDSPITLEFTVRKKHHYYSDETGLHNVVDGALAWMSIGEFGNASQEQEVSFLVDGNGGTKRVVFLDAAAGGIPQYNGLVEISNPQLGRKEVRLAYAEVPEGKWQGTVFYFSNFGDQNLDAWVAAKDAGLSATEYQQRLSQVGNAFLQKWGIFRKGWITYQEFIAALNATTSGSWDWPSTRDVCPWPAGACFLYDNPNGYVEYTSNRYAVPVPSGVSDLPLSMNLEVDDGTADPSRYAGKIVTQDAMQYHGDPEVWMQFAADPADPTACAAVSNDGMCILPLTGFQADVYVGGRFQRESAAEACPSADYAATRTPWLLTDFIGDTGTQGGQRFVYECRTKGAPFGSSALGEDRTDLNLNVAAANPLPNGRVLHRRLELIDGALVNQEHLVVIFREHFDSLLGRGSQASFDSYGVMLLHRQPTTLEAEDFEGWQVTSPPVMPDDALTVSCSDELVSEVLEGDPLDSTTAGRMARGVILGRRDAPAPPVLASGDDEQVHYYCEDTGQIDGAPEGPDLAVRHSCPWGSRVQFFTVQTRDGQGQLQAGCTQSAIADLECQDDGSCQDLLNLWRANSTCDIRFDPVWSCADPQEVYCDDDRLDLREGKVFYEESGQEPVFLPLRPAIDDAFRYKVRFQSRTGGHVGFAPEPCVEQSDAVPYCYAPADIEQIQDRVDCAVDLFTNYYDDLSAGDRSLLRDYLLADFARDAAQDRDGFERLNAELLIMLGDESFTRAYSSRFDLAAAATHSFQGSLFEPNGIDLSGQAGYEMYSLYEAAQYYQLALDRFYSLSPYLWESIDYAVDSPERNFVTQETVTEYLQRLIRASTQRSRVHSEIAKRYQGLNRPDLARTVIQRAYAAAYLESVILSHLMLKVVEVSSPAARDQIRAEVEDASRTYRAALLDMRDVSASISEEANVFGYPPDYIPFPALEPGDTNAFQKMLDIAKQRLAVARDKEDIAISSSRSYETDSASFQAELLQIQHNYENQLGDLCGTFTADDGRVYPAIPKYAHLHPVGKLLGNPCGLVGNGELHERQGAYKIATQDLQIALAHYDAKNEEIDNEKDRIEKYCDAVIDFADMMLERGQERESLLVRRNRWRATRKVANYAMEFAAQKVSMMDCITIVGTAAGTNCPQKGIAYGAYWAVRVASMATIVGASLAISNLEAQMRAHDRETASLETVQQCEYAKIDSEAKIVNLTAQTEALLLEVAKAHYGVLQAGSRIEAAHNRSQRLITQARDAEQMAINVEAARNDPNVRIYKNDSVISADRTFASALDAAYKATKVFEYYTSQSYAALDQLFLVRMVSHGQYNLESYLYALEDAYYSFQESYGTPDKRVAVLSLRDDLFDVPRISDEYVPLTEGQRTERFRQRLQDPSLRNGYGHIVVPFNTTLRRLSPLTRNHKILYVEAEFVGTDVGDNQGRVYLRQRGTGVVRGVSGDLRYHAFPERTSVVNTFFNGERFYVFSDEDVFRSYRLRDRPFVNTRWELVINPVDEAVNQDINLESLNDVRIYLYYTDFTSL